MPGRIPTEQGMLKSRPTLVNLANAIPVPDRPLFTGFRDESHTVDEHQHRIRRPSKPVAEVARPISLPPAVKVLSTRAKRKKAVSLAKTTASTLEHSAQGEIKVRRPYVRCERVSRHKRCVHDRRETRCVRDVFVIAACP